MGWGWKAVGLGLGAAVGGPLGAGIGAAIGHVFDSASGEEDVDAGSVIAGGFLSRFASETGHLDSKERELIADICFEVSDSNSLSRESVLLAVNEWATNDELFAQISVSALRASRSKPDRGIVTLDFRLFNQNDKTVLTYIDTVMFSRRPSPG